MGRFRQGRTPEAKEIEQVLSAMKARYAVASIPPYGWNDGVLTDVINHFISEEVNMHASPGIPYSALGSTNAVVLRDHGGLIRSIVKERLDLLSTGDCFALSAEERVKQGFCDPVRLFVKDEPHNVEKTLTRRFRLIMSVSLVDQLVERVLNSRLNHNEILHWRDIPSKGGSSMCLKGDMDFIKMWMLNRDLAEADVSGFDWSVKSWELQADVALRIALSPQSSLEWRKALENRVDCLSLSVFSLSDGRLISQLTKGIQKSGSFNTTPTNSHIRVMLAYLAGANEAIAVGDDGLEDYCCGAEAKYVEMGHPLKMYHRGYNRATFCSMYIDVFGKSEPTTWDKTFFRFLDSKVKNAERLIQLESVIGMSSQWDRICVWIQANCEGLSGWTVPAEIRSIVLGSHVDQTENSTTN